MNIQECNNHVGVTGFVRLNTRIINHKMKRIGHAIRRILINIALDDDAKKAVDDINRY